MTKWDHCPTTPLLLGDMRHTLLLAALLLTACGARKNSQSLVLSGGVSDLPGDGPPVCPWSPISSVEAREKAVWINDVEYDLGDELREASFLRLIEPCNLPDARSTFEAWRLHLAQPEPPDSPLSHISLGGHHQDMVPVLDREELGLQKAPLVKPREAGPDTEEERLRLAFEAALRPDP